MKLEEIKELIKMNYIKRALKILNWKKATKGMEKSQKVIATLYYPAIAIMW